MKLTKKEAKYRKRLFATFHMKKAEQKRIDRACNDSRAKYPFHNPYRNLYLNRKAIRLLNELLHRLKAGE